MKNHFLMFKDEDSAKESLSSYLVEGELDQSLVIRNQKVILSRAVYKEDEKSSEWFEEKPEVTLPGYFCTVSLPEVSYDLINLPDEVCRLIADSDTGLIEYAAPTVDVQMIASAIIEPIPSGSKYRY